MNINHTKMTRILRENKFNRRVKKKFKITPDPDLKKGEDVSFHGAIQKGFESCEDDSSGKSKFQGVLHMETEAPS